MDEVCLQWKKLDPSTASFDFGILGTWEQNLLIS